MSDLQKARPLFNEVLKGMRKTHGNCHLSTLTLIRNMGRLPQGMGELQDVRPLLEEALQGRRETLGYRHLETLTLIINMAELLRKMGELQEVRPQLKEMGCHPRSRTHDHSSYSGQFSAYVGISM